MKTETLDFEACAQNPLALFSNTPLLMTTIHRTQNLMKELLMQGVNGNNFQRMGTLLTYSRTIMTHYIEAHREMISFFGDISKMLEVSEHGATQPNEDDVDQLLENNHLFNNYLDDEEHIELLIESLVSASTIAISEKQLDTFFALPEVSTEKKVQAVNRMIGFVEKNLQLTTSFREGFAQTGAQSKAKLSSALHHDVISPTLYDGIMQAVDVDKEIEHEQNDDLELYTYLLKKKKQFV